MCDRSYTARGMSTDEDLIGRTSELDVAGIAVRALDLDAIIETKEHADRPKDRYQLPFLRQLHDEILKRERR